MSWTPVFDQTKEKWYFWNTTTNITSWDIPSSLDFSSLSPTDPFYSSKEYYSWHQQYSSTINPLKLNAPSIGSVSASGEVTGAFNVKTGKFQNITRDDRYVPDPKFSLIAKAERHMNLYFDYSGYQNERGAERQHELNHGPAKKKLSRKEIQTFKKKKKERQREKLLKEYKDDIDYYK